MGSLCETFLEKKSTCLVIMYMYVLKFYIECKYKRNNQKLNVSKQKRKMEANKYLQWTKKFLKNRLTM